MKPEHFQLTLIQPIKGQSKVQAGKEKQKVGRLRIRQLHPKAKIPTKGSQMAAGHDIYVIEAILIPARGKKLVEMGIAVGLPPGTHA